MSGVTDCYQPAEKKFRITRKCLDVLAEFGNPVSLITKNHLVTRFGFWHSRRMSPKPA